MLQYAAIILLALGLYGVLTNRNVIKIIVSLNVFEVGLNLYIITVAYVNGGNVPIYSDNASTNMTLFVDPLPHALVLTAIVIGVGTTAVGLSLAKKMYEKYDTYNLDEMEVLR
jgi:multicomponent Na+:H+ antiporter subunit C